MIKTFTRLTLFLLAFVSTEKAFAQKNISLLGRYQYGNNVKCSNLTGYVDSAGTEYALVGTTEGLSIVSLDTPANPKQLFLVPGATGLSSTWREVATYKGYAYVTTEQNSGLVVVDLRHLPDSINYHTIRPNNMRTSHTIFIDEKGIAYVNGTDVGQLFLALDSNLWEPPVVGVFTNNYVHDCFVRKDTMWAACINDGIIKVVDVTNKSDANNPGKTITAWATPQNFAHNCWLSDDSKYLFTTDEKPGSFLTCYDVTNLGNVYETDRAQIQPNKNAVIHNAYYLNNYVIASYYTAGIAIFDVLRKNNLVEVGHFDTSPFSGSTFNGAWGVWPYLPSGNIIVADVENGLWVLQPTYKRAAYLEGNVKNGSCGTNQNDVKVEIIGDSTVDFTNLLGNYNMGTVDTGTFTVRFSKTGYQTFDTANVSFRNGLLKKINVELVPVATTRLLIETSDSLTGDSLPFTRVLVHDTLGATRHEIATNNLGQYSFCDFVQGAYDFYAGRWGRQTVKVRYDDTLAEDTLELPTAREYYDDFIMDYGWTVSTNARSGGWVRGRPRGTEFEDSVANPGADVEGDFGRECYVTGNGGGAAGTDDVDDGYTVLRSPFFNIRNYPDPHITYYRWFYNDGGDGAAPNDSMIVTLTNGVDTVRIDSVFTSRSGWVYTDIRVKDFMPPNVNMRIEFRIEDYAPGHIVEGGVDFFRLYNGTDTVVIDTTTDTTIIDTAVYIDPIGPSGPSIRAFPNPSNNVVNIFVEGVKATDATLVLTNTLGQVVYTKKLSTRDSMTLIDEKLPSGLYFVKVIENKRITGLQKLLRTD